jgi:hypothetical protein
MFSLQEDRVSQNRFEISAMSRKFQQCHWHHWNRFSGVIDTAEIRILSVISANTKLFAKRFLSVNKGPIGAFDWWKKNRESKISWHCPLNKGGDGDDGKEACLMIRVTTYQCRCQNFTNSLKDTRPLPLRDGELLTTTDACDRNHRRGKIIFPTENHLFRGSYVTSDGTGVLMSIKVLQYSCYISQNNSFIRKKPA